MLRGVRVYQIVCQQEGWQLFASSPGTHSDTYTGLPLPHRTANSTHIE